MAHRNLMQTIKDKGSISQLLCFSSIKISSIFLLFSFDTLNYLQNIEVGSGSGRRDGGRPHSHLILITTLSISGDGTTIRFSLNWRGNSTEIFWISEIKVEKLFENG
jgi:hypothetical protein